MPPEVLEEARSWLTKATRDLLAAEYLASAEVPLLDIVVYHCQQAMEKALKGYLTAKSIPFAKTHALGLLVEQASDLDKDFESLLDHAESLSPFATRFRYPGDLLEPDEREAEGALRLAGEAVGFILDRLSDDLRSFASPPSETRARVPPQVAADDPADGSPDLDGTAEIPGADRPGQVDPTPVR